LVSITPGAVRVNDPVTAGSALTLPTLTVADEGDDPATFVMATTSVCDPQRLTVDPAWIGYDVVSFPLDPSGSEHVTATVNVPSDAPAGVYEVLLQAKVQITTGTSGTAAPAAAARAIFEITATTPWWDNPRLILALAVIAALAIAWLLRFLIRRSGYTITIHKSGTADEKPAG
jgi:hypothetical protein